MSFLLRPRKSNGPSPFCALALCVLSKSAFRIHNGFAKWSRPLDMDKAFVFPPNAPRKATARVAVVDINDASRTLLAECFRQFGIETVAMSSDSGDRLHKEKFEACVLSLKDGSGPLIAAARTSPPNSRCVIYGFGGNAQEAMRYSKYGINAMFHEPLERPAALKLVRATQNLVLHEFRRYVRIPLLTEVSVVGEGHRLLASSIEMSTGGMSVKSPEELTVGKKV